MILIRVSPCGFLWAVTALALLAAAIALVTTVVRLVLVAIALVRLIRLILIRLILPWLIRLILVLGLIATICSLVVHDSVVTEVVYRCVETRLFDAMNIAPRSNLLGELASICERFVHVDAGVCHIVDVPDRHLDRWRSCRRCYRRCNYDHTRCCVATSVVAT